MKRSKTKSTMGRRRIAGWDEQDVHTGWRHVLVYMGRAGTASAAKRRTRRRERHTANVTLRREGFDW